MGLGSISITFRNIKVDKNMRSRLLLLYEQAAALRQSREMTAIER